ncbi:MAG: AAA family ATPase [Planctomycetaceae bacterium]
MHPQTKLVLEFLSSPSSYAHRPPLVRRLQTHASWVFLAPPYVYKVKQPVDLGFLNFQQLSSRRQNCEAEVRLNRRLAEDVYLGVLAVCQSQQVGAGQPQLKLIRVAEGAAEPPGTIDWVVQMRQLSEDGFLLHRLRVGTAQSADFDRVVDRLLTFYRTQPPVSEEISAAAFPQVCQRVQENFTAARSMPEAVITPQRLAFLQQGSAEFVRQQATLLEGRGRAGWIRDVHGDLHLEHIHIDERAVRIYDCLEFNDSLRQIDVAADAAFLAMDLDFHGRADWSRHLVRRLSAELPDPDLPRVIRWYQAYRACVRGKVEYLRSLSETATAVERVDAQQRAARYFQLASHYMLTGDVPRLLAFAGQVASGKTALAKFAAAESGWTLLSSDCIRKQLAGVDLNYRGTEAERAVMYSGEFTQRVYANLYESALEKLRAGENVIVDATFSRRAARDALAAVAASANAELIWIFAEVSDDVRLQRLRDRERRSDVISDAREADLQTLAARFEAPEELSPAELIRVDTGTAMKSSQSAWLAEMARRQATGVAT